MRKVLAFLLLAGAAAPALAAGAPGDHFRNRDSGTQAASEDRSDHSSRQHSDRGNRGNDGGSQSQSESQSNSGGNSERPHFNSYARPDRSGGEQVQVQPVTQSSSNGNSGEQRFHNGFRSRFSSGGQVQTVEAGNGGGGEPAVQRIRRDERDSSDTVRNWRGPKIVEPQDGAVSPTLRQSDHRTPSVFRNRVPIVSNTPREGTQPPLRVENHRRRDTVHWSTTNWRSDHRYDWREHRRRHRSIFHLGIYFDPFNWGYRPYQIGWRLWPSYYSSNFWINDPYQYRLPYAPPGYRWIRYYDDALLVDTWNGEVVDVIYNFFW